MNHVTVEVDMLIVIIVIGVVIALSVWSNRLGIAPPLILMVVGVGVSYFLSIPQINLEIPVIEPEWILAVILPPLLYAAAIAIPTVDLRRDFAAVGGLAVVLVIVSAVVLGFIFHWLIPGVSLPLGIAIGAILSPTDAAATTIVRRLGVPHRVGLILQGESLLNDATALVLLRSAIVAAGAVADSFSLWDAVGDFLWAALAAAVIGILVGWLGVQVRRIVRSPAPATAISLIVPFVAWLPAEVVHASGLVAAVAAGLTAAHLGPKHMDARQRLAERSNWHTMEFLLEGAVFLLMGLELRTLVNDVYADHETIGVALGLAGIGFLVVLILRSGYLAIVLQGTKARTERQNARRDRWRAADPQEREARMRARIGRARPAIQAQFENHFDALMTRFRRFMADVDYLVHQPLGIKEGTLLSWAGMRGVVTLAAAQTLPFNTPHRSLIILIAFIVAAGALLIQGGTLSWVVKALGLAGQDTTPEGEWARLQDELAQAAPSEQDPTLSEEQAALIRVKTQRKALLDLRSTGSYTSHSMSAALADLDAQELSIQVHLGEAE